jgi:TonB family protein
MNDALIYFLKVNIAIALFYLFYRLAFYNDTFWKTRRFYLLFSILLSVVYPLISLTGWLEKQEPMQAIMVNYVQLQGITVNATPASNLTIENILLAAYALVSIILLIKMVVQLISILRWKLKGKKQLLHGIEIVAIDKTITPFSFFNAIFINPALHNEHETNQILTHELTHAQQMHSMDVLISEMLTIVCWINPAAWLLKREIRQNLEFLADNNVLESGFDSKNYQYHLLQLSYQTPEVKLGNKFNVSPLKKRIIMMNQQKSKKAGLLKYSLIVPLALALVLSSNAQTIVNSAKKTLSTTENSVVSTTENVKAQAISKTEDSKTMVKPTNKTEDSKTEVKPTNKNQVYDVVEKMPQYPGGEKALLEYIGQHLRYPADAHQNGIQGRIIVRFIVNESGKVGDAEVVRGVYPSIDAEGLKVVNSLPDWIPGEQNGKKVAVYYTLPITFKLDGGKSDKTTDKDWNTSYLCIIDGIEQPIGFDFNSIKRENILNATVIEASSEELKAKLIAKYGQNAKRGVINVTLKKK